MPSSGELNALARRYKGTLEPTLSQITPMGALRWSKSLGNTNILFFLDKNDESSGERVGGSKKMWEVISPPPSSCLLLGGTLGNSLEEAPEYFSVVNLWEMPDDCENCK